MELFTNEQIQNLITCEKIITEPPKKEMKLENGSFRKDMKVESIKENYQFSVFIRKHELFSENFSIGLKYNSMEGKSIILYRCNGPHNNKSFNDLEIPHVKYHIHKIDAEDLNNELEEPKRVTITECYATYEDALAYFIRETGIRDAESYFPELQASLSLFEEGES